MTKDRCNCNNCRDCIRARAEYEMQASIDLEKAVLGKRNPATILQRMVDRMKKESPQKKSRRRKRPVRVRTVIYSRTED